MDLMIYNYEWFTSDTHIEQKIKEQKKNRICDKKLTKHKEETFKQSRTSGRYCYNIKLTINLFMFMYKYI